MTLRQLRVPAAVSARRLVADPGGLAVSILFYLLVTSVLSALWRIAAHNAGGELLGYSAVALTWYVATSEAAVVALNQRLIEEIGNDVASGSIAVELLRPARVVAVRLATETARGIVRVGALLIPGVALAWVTAGAPPSATTLVLVAPALVLAVSCNVAMQHTVAAMAFWIRDAKTGWFLYQKVVFLLGGMLLPLQVLPDAVQSVAMRLPFMAMAYAPARLASGHFEPGLIAIQAGWLIALVALAIAVFAAGERRLQVVGG